MVYGIFANLKGNQLRSASYRVKKAERYKVPDVSSKLQTSRPSSELSDDEYEDKQYASSHPLPLPDISDEISSPPKDHVTFEEECDKYVSYSPLPELDSNTTYPSRPTMPDTNSEPASDPPHEASRPVRKKQLPVHLKDFFLY